MAPQADSGVYSRDDSCGHHALQKNEPHPRRKGYMSYIDRLCYTETIGRGQKSSPIALLWGDFIAGRRTENGAVDLVHQHTPWLGSGGKGNGVGSAVFAKNDSVYHAPSRSAPSLADDSQKVFRAVQLSAKMPVRQAV